MTILPIFLLVKDPIKLDDIYINWMTKKWYELTNDEEIAIGFFDSYPPWKWLWSIKKHMQHKEIGKRRRDSNNDSFTSRSPELRLSNTWKIAVFTFVFIQLWFEHSKSNETNKNHCLDRIIVYLAFFSFS